MFKLLPPFRRRAIVALLILAATAWIGSWATWRSCAGMGGCVAGVAPPDRQHVPHDAPSRPDDRKTLSLGGSAPLTAALLGEQSFRFGNAIRLAHAIALRTHRGGLSPRLTLTWRAAAHAPRPLFSHCSLQALFCTWLA